MEELKEAFKKSSMLLDALQNNKIEIEEYKKKCLVDFLENKINYLKFQINNYEYIDNILMKKILLRLIEDGLKKTYDKGLSNNNSCYETMSKTYDQLNYELALLK